MAEWLCSGLQSRGHRFDSVPSLHPSCSQSPGGGIGRRCGLKIRFPKGSAGSSPAPGTKYIKAFSENRGPFFGNTAYVVTDFLAAGDCHVESVLGSPVAITVEQDENCSNTNDSLSVHPVASLGVLISR